MDGPGPQIVSGWLTIHLESLPRPQYVSSMICVHFGNVEQLKQLSIYLYVYLQQGNELSHNCMGLLYRFQPIEKGKLDPYH